MMPSNTQTASPNNPAPGAEFSGQATSPYTVADFDRALQQLGWKASDFCRATGLHRNTPSRWRNEGVPVPEWVDKHLRLLLEIKRLYAAFLDIPRP